MGKEVTKEDYVSLVHVVEAITQARLYAVLGMLS